MLGALLVLPALGFAQEQPAAKATSPVDTLAVQSAAPMAAQPSFDLKNAAVQEIIRAATASDASQLSLTGPQQAAETASTRPALQDLPFRAPRRAHHMDCDSFNCVAYTADDQALYTIPREQYYGVNSSDPQKAWLSCQSGNDLLTTFERYDKCRGVTIGLPLQGHDVIVDLPKIRL